MTEEKTLCCINKLFFSKEEKKHKIFGWEINDTRIQNIDMIEKYEEQNNEHEYFIITTKNYKKDNIPYNNTYENLYSIDEDEDGYLKLITFDEVMDNVSAEVKKKFFGKICRRVKAGMEKILLYLIKNFLKNMDDDEMDELFSDIKVFDLIENHDRFAHFRHDFSHLINDPSDYDQR